VNTNQKIIYKWLNEKLNLNVFAEAYAGAAQMIQAPTQGHITFVSHMGRDFINSLATTVKNITPGRIQYVQLVDDIQKSWKDEWGAKGITSPAQSPNGNTIPYNTCARIQMLLNDHKAGRERSDGNEEIFFMTFLAYSDREKIPKNYMDEWKAAKKWFMAHAHVRKAPFAANARDEAIKHFKILEGMLYVAASSEYARIKQLDEILEDTNS
jgi:hypothetical protein